MIKKIKIIGYLCILSGFLMFIIPLAHNQIREIIYQKELEKNFISQTYYGILEINKINFKREFYALNDPQNNVDENIELLAQSIMPNSSNNSSHIIIAAHSGYASNAYFKNLYKLTIGDQVKIYYQNQLYLYEIVEIEEQDKTGILYLKEDYLPMLSLITCTKNNNQTQTIYYAKLINVLNLS